MWSLLSVRILPQSSNLRLGIVSSSSSLPRLCRSFGTVTTTSAKDDDDVSNAIRLSKLVASQAGISRREAERWIRDGDVTIAGQVVRSPQQWIPDFESLVAGHQLKARGKALFHRSTTASDPTTTPRTWLVHKVAGELVADSDPLGRPCFTLPKQLIKNVHLKPIGRLDMNTEGLIVVTDSGEYARDLERSKLHRTYRVRAHGRVLLDQLQRRFKAGLTLDNGTRFAPMKIVVDEPSRRGRSATNTWFQVTCTQGKNRQVRKAFEQFGCKWSVRCSVYNGVYSIHCSSWTGRLTFACYSF